MVLRQTFRSLQKNQMKTIPKKVREGNKLPYFKTRIKRSASSINTGFARYFNLLNCQRWNYKLFCLEFQDVFLNLYQIPNRNNPTKQITAPIKNANFKWIFAKEPYKTLVPALTQLTIIVNTQFCCSIYGRSQGTTDCVPASPCPGRYGLFCFNVL